VIYQGEIVGGQFNGKRFTIEATSAKEAQEEVNWLLHVSSLNDDGDAIVKEKR